MPFSVNALTNMYWNFSTGLSCLEWISSHGIASDAFNSAHYAVQRPAQKRVDLLSELEVIARACERVATPVE